MEPDQGTFERDMSARLRAELDALDVSLPIAAAAPYRIRPLKLVPALAMAVGAALVLGTVAAVASSTPYVGQLVQAAEQTLGLPSHRPDTTTVNQPSPSPSVTPTERAEPSGSPESEAPGGSGAERESPDPTRSSRGSPEPGEGAGGSSPGDG